MVIHNSDFPMDDSLKWHPESLASEVVRPAPVRDDNCIIIGTQVMHVKCIYALCSLLCYSLSQFIYITYYNPVLE
jgi:hypothetical protein